MGGWRTRPWFDFEAMGFVRGRVRPPTAAPTIRCPVFMYMSYTYSRQQDQLPAASSTPDPLLHETDETTAGLATVLDGPPLVKSLRRSRLMFTVCASEL